MGMNLFDGSDEDEELSKIEIDKEFARRYEHNKKREDLQRFEELKKKGVIDSDSGTDDEEESEEDDDEGVLGSRKEDSEFFDALIRIKKQDPDLKNEKAKLFESEEEEEEDDEEGGYEDKTKRKKPMYLKDVTAKHLIEEGPEFEEREEPKKSYVEEQEQLRNELLVAMDNEFDGVGGDDDDGFLKLKEGRRDEDEGEDGDGLEEKLDAYFGDNDKLDENEMFLKDYFRKRLWLGNKEDKKELDEEGLVGVSEDEEEIDRQEDYEREFNFRFEENAGDRVMGYSRVVDGSVRKKTNARKRQRESKEERLALAEFERNEELKHLKNLKKKEINEKLRKIRETAGIRDDNVALLDEDDLEEEFDPEEYDRKMKKAFDDEYYEADDAVANFGSDSELEKPDFDKEDELLGLPKGWDDNLYGSGDGFSAARERVLKRKATYLGDDEQLGHEEGAELQEDKKKKMRKRSKEEEEVLNKELEEYYKLDYEDDIGGLKTRFKYKPVNSRKFGLSTEAILLMDDKELNQYVPLKKLAPYKDEEFKVPRSKKLEQKQKIRSLFETVSANGEMAGKKNLIHGGKRPTRLLDANKTETTQPEFPNNDENGVSKKSKRKKRQAELKLTLARRLAYGILSQPKSKKTRKAS